MHNKQERSCVACRQKKLQTEMLRIAKINGEFVLDEAQKLAGRGAYVCKTKSCLSLTIKKKQLNRAFKTNVPNEIYEKLGEYEQNC